MAHAAARGAAVFTVTPEFLPPPYCWVSLSDGSPVVDVSAINDDMAAFVRQLFEETVGGGGGEEKL
jgi:hypothetical protein